MAITYRSMRPGDVRECVEIVAAHPIVGPRYGDGIGELKRVWLGLLDREAFRPVVFEWSQDSHARVIGVAASAFVCDDFLHALKRPPFFWVGPELTRRIVRGESPLLSNREVREANAKGGLKLVMWEGTLRTEFFGRVDSHTAVFSAFIEQHRGFLLNEIIGHATTRDVLDAALRSGALLLQEDGRYVDPVDRSLDRVFEEPHHFGLTRELAPSRTGSWVGSLFVYQSPQCGFRPSEQRLLLAALRGGTDQELTRELGISLSAVKKMWLSIYGRVSTHLPSLLPDRDSMQEVSERGKEKKQRLLAYLREHPEELRPALP